jgi:cytidylate kinase
VSPSRIIAIDGPAGSGKSSTARAVAEKLSFAHLDSGALYRAVTLATLDAKVPAWGQAIVGLVQSLPIRLAMTDEGFRPEVAGVDVSEAIRAPRVTGEVSAIAAVPAVREWVNRELRSAAATHPRGIVMDGRDIGTVVFPDAPVKVFLTASPEERAKRRSGQMGAVTERMGLKEIQADLERRDAADSRREAAPLVRAPDAILLDTTRMSFAEQVDAVVRMAVQAFNL